MLADQLILFQQGRGKLCPPHYCLLPLPYIFRPSVGSAEYMSVWSEVGESNFLEASSPQPIQHSAKVFQTHFCKNRAWKFDTLNFS